MLTLNREKSTTQYLNKNSTCFKTAIIKIFFICCVMCKKHKLSLKNWVNFASDNQTISNLQPSTEMEHEFPSFNTVITISDDNNSVIEISSSDSSSEEVFADANTDISTQPFVSYYEKDPKEIPDIIMKNPLLNAALDTLIGPFDAANYQSQLNITKSLQNNDELSFLFNEQYKGSQTVFKTSGYATTENLSNDSTQLFTTIFTENTVANIDTEQNSTECISVDNIKNFLEHNAYADVQIASLTGTYKNNTATAHYSPQRSTQFPGNDKNEVDNAFKSLYSQQATGVPNPIIVENDTAWNKTIIISPQDTETHLLTPTTLLDYIEITKQCPFSNDHFSIGCACSDTSVRSNTPTNGANQFLVNECEMLESNGNVFTYIDGNYNLNIKDDETMLNYIYEKDNNNNASDEQIIKFETRKIHYDDKSFDQLLNQNNLIESSYIDKIADLMFEDSLYKPY